MSEYRKKITIRVSSQTAYHLEAEAERWVFPLGAWWMS